LEPSRVAVENDSPERESCSAQRSRAVGPSDLYFTMILDRAIPSGFAPIEVSAMTFAGPAIIATTKRRAIDQKRAGAPKKWGSFIPGE
jgi:hypothetical protein